MSLIRQVTIQDPTDSTRLAELDNLGKWMVSIDESHHEIHEGDSFTANSADTSMALSDTLILAFKTPDTTKWVHLIASYTSKAAGHVDIFEGPTWDASSGSQLPVYNSERNSSNTTAVLEDTTGVFTDTNNIVLNPTTFAGGTAIRTLYVFAAKSSGGGERNTEEIILKQGTTYGICFTADAGSNAADVHLTWYEHTGA